MKLHRLMAMALVAALTACAHETRSTAVTHDPNARTELRVSLFRWIPEENAFAAWIESEFEADNPGIDLIVRPMEMADQDDNDLSYDSAATIAALTQGGPDRQDLVEIDTVLLQLLVDNRAVAPFSISRSDFLPFARQAATINNHSYGVPHWTCGYFVITEHATLGGAPDASGFLARLNSLQNGRMGLTGNITSGWDSVTVYLDAYRDTHQSGSLDAALSGDGSDTSTITALRAIGQACTHNGEATCDDDADQAATRVATGQANALLGYSERANAILAASSDPGLRARLRLTSAPLGDGSHPLFFTDALVLSPRCASAQCQDAARRFAEFYVSDEVFETVMMARDAGPQSIPRYLLASTRGAFATPGVRADPIYRQLSPIVATGEAYPNAGIPAARDRRRIRTMMNQVVHGRPS